VKRVLKGIVTLLCVGAIVIVVLIVVVPALLGLQRYVITGGSMTGTISRGSVIYSRLTPTDQLKVGDIITFYPPGHSAPGRTASSPSTRARTAARLFVPRETSTRSPTPGRSTWSSPSRRAT